MSEAVINSGSGEKNSKNKRKPPKSPGLAVLMKIFEKLSKLIVTIILIAVVTASIAGCVLVLFIAKNMQDTDNIPDLSKLGTKGTSSIYIKDKKASTATKDVFVHHQDLDGVKSIWVDFDQIPSHMKWAVIAIEDHRFYDHNGVDWKRTAAATLNYFIRSSDREFGGSTITQQLIKNVDGDDAMDVSRKIREIFKAVKMESQAYLKDDILEAYLNILPLSSGVDGVGAAAQYFFGKDVSDLSLAECAVIAGMTQNPSKFSPYGRPENVRERQRTVLATMYSREYISKEEYLQAYNEELIFSNSMKQVDQQDYYVDYLIKDVANALIKEAESRGEYLDQKLAIIQVYTGGFQIYSAEDPEIQAAVDKIMVDKKYYPKNTINSSLGLPSAGITVLDYTGKIVALSSGHEPKTGNRVGNLATDAYRHPGSSMKPISAYAPAINANIVTFSTIIQDKPITKINGKNWPQNYGGSRPGAQTIDVAIQKSTNTIAVQVGVMYGVNRAFDFLTQKLHFSTLIDSKDYYVKETQSYETKSDRNASMFLGGLTEGVNTLEMAAAYQIFGNGGVYNRPYSFYRLERDGEVFLNNVPQGEQAINEDSAYIMNRLLQKVITGESSPTARGTKVGNHVIFGKTGTSNDDKDFYFAGGSGHYVSAVWFGYKTSQQKMSGNQSGGALNIWKAVMNKIHEGLEPAEFTKTGGVAVRKYCRSTGKLASAGCPHDQLITGYYKADFVPGICTSHGGGAYVGDTPATKPDETTTTPETTAPTSETNTTTSGTTTTTPTTTTTVSPENPDGD